MRVAPHFTSRDEVDAVRTRPVGTRIDGVDPTCIRTVPALTLLSVNVFGAV